MHNRTLRRAAVVGALAAAAFLGVIDQADAGRVTTPDGRVKVTSTDGRVVVPTSRVVTPDGRVKSGARPARPPASHRRGPAPHHHQKGPPAMHRAAVALTALLLTLLPLVVPRAAQAAIPRPTRVVIVGDSLLEGCCCWPAGTTTTRYVPAADRWYSTLAEKMGWPYEAARSAQGGTGYTNPGPAGSSRQTYPDRVGAFLKLHPTADLVIIEGGINDYTSDLAVYRTAVDRTYDTVRAVLPGARVAIVPGYSANGYINPGRLGVIKDEAGRRSWPVVDWTRTINGRQDLLWQRDRFHPNYTGHYVLGAEAARQLKAAGW